MLKVTAFFYSFLLIDLYTYVVDCKWSLWNEWTSCWSEACARSQERTIEQHSAHGGKSCEGQDIKTEKCLEQIDICSRETCASSVAMIVTMSQFSKTVDYTILEELGSLSSKAEEPMNQFSNNFGKKIDFAHLDSPI